MTFITEAKLRQVAPKYRAKDRQDQDKIIAELARTADDVLAKFEIDTPRRIAHFFAQCCHESAGFRTTTEYASGAAYEGRQDLGNTRRGDGRKFRGHGLIQTTGRANTTEFNTWVHKHYPDAPDFVKNPHLISEFPWALLSAVFYWQSRRLNRYADQGQVKVITKRVNGGYNGLKDRELRLAKGKKAFGNGTQVVLGSRSHDNQPAPPRNEYVIRLGDQGSHVKDLQVILNEKGYHVGRADGIFGKLTRNAVAKLKLENSMDTSDHTMPITLAQARAAQVHDRVRENMTMKDLREGGSKQVSNADLGQKITGAAGAAGAVTAALPEGDEEKTIAEQASDLLEKGETAQSLIERVKGLVGSLMDGATSNLHHIVMIAVAAAVVFWLFQRAKERRLEEAKMLKNL